MDIEYISFWAMLKFSQLFELQGPKDEEEGSDENLLYKQTLEQAARGRESALLHSDGGRVADRLRFCRLSAPRVQHRGTVITGQ